jgi:hypothetical protein
MAVDGVRDLHRVITRTVVHDDDLDLLRTHLVKDRSESVEAGGESQ